jgi:nitroreductase
MSETAGEMSVRTAIRRKRAVRRYRPDALPADVEQAILQAGRRAQSSKNTQPWTFVVVREPAQLQALAQAGTYAAHMPISAMTVVLVAAAGTDFDLGQAAAYMQLAATELGVGSCVTTLHNQELARSVLGVPAELQCRWSVTFGYPADDDRPAKMGGRRPLEDIVRNERYADTSDAALN